MSPYSPGDGVAWRITSSRTSSTEVDERLPTSRSDRQLVSRAARGTDSASSTASRTLGPPGCAIHAAMSRRASPRLLEEHVHVRREVLEHHLGDVGRQHHLEPALGDAPPHHGFGVRVEDRLAGEHTRAGMRKPRACRGACCAGHDRRGSPVAEEARRDQVGNRQVFPLQGERAQFHREENRHLVRVRPHVVRGARHAGRAGQAAEAENRRAPDARGEAQPVHQQGVERRRRDPGDRDEQERVHVGDPEARAFERGPHGPLADLERHLDPGVVGLAPRLEAAVGLQRQREVPAAHENVPVELLDAVQVVVPGGPLPLERGNQRVLVVVVGRERPAHGSNARRALWGHT